MVYSIQTYGLEHTNEWFISSKPMVYSIQNEWFITYRPMVCLVEKNEISIK